VTLPWLLVIEPVTVRPKLTPPESRAQVTVDSQPKHIAGFGTRLKTSKIVLTAPGLKSEFQLSVTDVFETLVQFGPQWRVLQPEWRFVYNLIVDCIGQPCVVPSTVTFTLNGKFDNQDGSRTDEGVPIDFTARGREMVALHAGEYTVTMTV